MSEQLDLLTDLRDAGMEQAETHANAVEPEWSDRAMDCLRAFMRSGPMRFSAPDVRDFAVAHGLPRPPIDRAWGPIFMRASRAGLIVADGFKQASREMHNQPIRIWRKAN